MQWPPGPRLEGVAFGCGRSGLSCPHSGWMDGLGGLGNSSKGRTLHGESLSTRVTRMSVVSPYMETSAHVNLESSLGMCVSNQSMRV